MRSVILITNQGTGVREMALIPKLNTISIFFLFTLVAGCQVNDVEYSQQVDQKKNNLTKIHSYQNINIQTDYQISEVALIDATDLNNDGIDDFVVGFMTDPVSQLGIECCEVPKSRIKDLKKLPVYAVVSGPNGYQVSIIPGSDTHRTWAGKFFDIDNVTYLYLGHNGEIGLPQENAGEKSALYKIRNSSNNISFEKVWEAKRRTVTSSVSVNVTGNSVYILESNYGKGSIRKVPSSVYDTVMYSFNGSSMKGVELPNRLKTKSADNYLRLIDYDSDGKLDILAASEVWKSLDGKSLQTSWPGSYVVNDVFNNKSKIRLTNAAFGDDHAGMAIALMENQENKVIVEASTGFYGHQGGGFKGSRLTAYLPDEEMKQAKVTGQLNSEKGTFRDLHQFISDGERYLVPGYYTARPQVISLLDEAVIRISTLNVRGYNNTGRGSASAIIPLSMENCMSFATTRVNIKSKSVKIQTSSCLN